MWIDQINFFLNIKITNKFWNAVVWCLFTQPTKWYLAVPGFFCFLFLVITSRQLTLSNWSPPGVQQKQSTNIAQRALFPTFQVKSGLGTRLNMGITGTPPSWIGLVKVRANRKCLVTKHFAIWPFCLVMFDRIWWNMNLSTLTFYQSLVQPYFFTSTIC